MSNTRSNEAASVRLLQLQNGIMRKTLLYILRLSEHYSDTHPLQENNVALHRKRWLRFVAIADEAIMLTDKMEDEDKDQLFEEWKYLLQGIDYKAGQTAKHHH